MKHRTITKKYEAGKQPTFGALLYISDTTFKVAVVEATVFDSKEQFLGRAAKLGQHLDSVNFYPARIMFGNTWECNTSAEAVRKVMIQPGTDLEKVISDIF